MALVTMKSLLTQAGNEQRGVGAFSVGNMEMVKGAVRAAEETDTPIILQIAEVRLPHSPLELMGPMMVQAAKEAKVDIAVHLDHGLTEETVKKALELGFTSVMYDSSTYSFEENIERTKKIVKLAKNYGATVEAELGLVGGSEDGSCDHGIRCTDPEDAGLHGITGELEIEPYTGSNPLYKYGQIRVMPDGHHLMHEDGKPFIWLGDTWWMVFSSRINGTDEIQYLTKDRADKGFTVIQMINGLWCDVHAFDRRGKNEEGYCWEANWERINPYFYDSADVKMEAIINAGLVPLLAGSWGFYMGYMGVEKMKQHYRYMVARYSAYPLMWNVGGETCMPGYYGDTKDPENPKSAGPKRKQDWADVLDYLKAIDPYNRTAIAHETAGVMPKDGLPNQEILDVVMFQGTHCESREAVAHAVNAVKPLVALEPARPVINGETCYEGMLNNCGPEIQRMIFWNTMLKGGAGWTYGA